MRASGLLAIMLAFAACSETESRTPNAAGEGAAGKPGASAPTSSSGIDCGRAAGQAEQAVCADQELLALDRLSGPADAPLRSARQACGRDDDLKSCLVRVYAERIAERSRDGQPEQAVTGPIAYVCGAERLTATFIDSGKGYLVLDADARVAVLGGSPAASGARYEGSLDDEPWSFRTKGRDATLVRGGTESRCSETAAGN